MVASNSGNVKLRNKAGLETGISGPMPGFWMAKRPIAIASRLHRIITSPVAGDHAEVPATAGAAANSIVEDINVPSPLWLIQKKL